MASPFSGRLPLKLDQVADGFTHLTRADYFEPAGFHVGAKANIPRAISLIESFCNCSLDTSSSGGQFQRVLEHHGDGGNRSDRIRQTFARNVGSRAMDGFVEADLSADRRRRQHSQASGEHAAFVAEDIAKNVV